MYCVRCDVARFPFYEFERFGRGRCVSIAGLGVARWGAEGRMVSCGSYDHMGRRAGRLTEWGCGVDVYWPLVDIVFIE